MRENHGYLPQDVFFLWVELLYRQDRLVSMLTNRTLLLIENWIPVTYLVQYIYFYRILWRHPWNITWGLIYAQQPTLLPLRRSFMYTGKQAWHSRKDGVSQFVFYFRVCFCGLLHLILIMTEGNISAFIRPVWLHSHCNICTFCYYATFAKCTHIYFVHCIYLFPFILRDLGLVLLFSYMFKWMVVLQNNYVCYSRTMHLKFCYSSFDAVDKEINMLIWLFM